MLVTGSLTSIQLRNERFAEISVECRVPDVEIGISHLATMPLSATLVKRPLSMGAVKPPLTGLGSAKP